MHQVAQTPQCLHAWPTRYSSFVSNVELPRPHCLPHTLPPTRTPPFMLSLCVQTIGEASTQDKDRLEKLLYQHECDGLAIEVRLHPQPPFCIASLILLHCIVIDKSCPHSPPPQDCIGSGAHGHHPSEIQLKPCTDTLTH